MSVFNFVKKYFDYIIIIFSLLYPNDFLAGII